MPFLCVCHSCVQGQAEEEEDDHDKERQRGPRLLYSHGSSRQLVFSFSGGWVKVKLKLSHGTAAAGGSADASN